MPGGFFVAYVIESVLPRQIQQDGGSINCLLLTNILDYVNWQVEVIPAKAGVYEYYF